MSHIVVQKHAFFETEDDLPSAIAHCQAIATATGCRIYLAKVVLYRDPPVKQQPPSPPEKGGEKAVDEEIETAMMARAA